jgi:two-component system sensor histidine kinase KdpD
MDLNDQPKRGRYKIFLGMAAGVGKTYRMLQEGHALADSGHDVVIGYVEPHRRPETSALVEGLEAVPTRRVTYRDKQLDEMDLPGILRRKPEICLIDELAHTNVPGVEHRKRYEDIDDVLAAGIDVFSTVNVQHLESLNDEVAELTGVTVRETFPDSVLTAADEVVLIDLTPQALVQRLHEGKIYPSERVPIALTSFFMPENLAALRELALRQVAQEVEQKRGVRGAQRKAATKDDERVATSAPQAVAERLLALVSLGAGSQRLIRRAWRSAQRYGAELDLLYVSAGKMSSEQTEQLESLRKLATLLGAHFLVESGSDVAEVAARIARMRGTTYVLIGRPSERRGLGKLKEPLALRLLRLLPGVDLRIVTDRAKRRTEVDRDEG